MKILIQDKYNTTVNLTDRDYVTEGGEGKIYSKNGMIYKLYSDKTKIIPKAKIDELKQIDRTTILAPQNLVLDSKLTPIGITMKLVNNVEPICKLFSNEFKKRFNIDEKNILELIENLAKTIKFIHSKKCLIVDGNEMNYLVDNKKFKIPYFIDVDSYQTPHFPATAISPAIKDYHCKKFSPLSDWFSFGVISVQLFLGIHPYKGTHPNYKKYELEKRMRDNASIFNNKVKLPKLVNDFSYIPKNYLDWFIKVFEKGQRLLPPSIAGQIIISVPVTVIQSTNLFIIELKDEMSDDIIKYKNGAIFTSSSVFISNKTISIEPTTDILLTKQSLTPILIDIKDNKLVLKDLNLTEISTQIQARKKTFVNDMFFILMNDLLCEVDVEEINSKFIPLIKSTWNVLPNATKLFDGVIYQDILGIPYLMLPYKDKNGKTCCSIKAVPELARYNILEAKHDNNVIIVIGYKHSKYTKFTFKFDENYVNYNCRKEVDVEYHIPNFVVLDNGIAINITPEDDVEIFSVKLDKPDIKQIKDKSINFGMKLCKDGINVMFRNNNKLFKLSMNK